MQKLKKQKNETKPLAGEKWKMSASEDLMSFQRKFYLQQYLKDNQSLIFELLRPPGNGSSEPAAPVLFPFPRLVSLSLPGSISRYNAFQVYPYSHRAVRQCTSGSDQNRHK